MLQRYPLHLMLLNCNVLLKLILILMTATLSSLGNMCIMFNSARSKLKNYVRKNKEDKKSKKLDNTKINDKPHVEPVKIAKVQFSTSPQLEKNWLEHFQAKRENKKKDQNIQSLESDLENQSCNSEFVIQLRLINSEVYSLDLTLTEDCAEPLEEEPDMVELTNADYASVQRAVHGPPHEVLISKFNLNITRRDIHTLLGQNWLNDEIINFYMNLITDRSEKKHLSHGLPRVYAMNTFFLQRLMESGYDGVKRWTRKIDIFSKDIIPVPVQVYGVHWCMAIIHLKERSIKYYDSMGSPNRHVLAVLEQYLIDESIDKRAHKLDTRDFEIASVRDVPLQLNDGDCGVFSCMFAEYICRNKRINFSQHHMDLFRQQMILEIVRGELLQ